jgi:RNA polymerase sigma factor (sigma-70 family)
MNRTPSAFATPAEALALHLRLLQPDPTATADVCQAYLAPLAGWLATCFPRADPDLAQTAAGDAVMAYVQRPEAYDPARHELGAYLRLAARRDLLNLLRQEQRHQHEKLSQNCVELGQDGGNIPGREEEPSAALERAEEAHAGQEFLRRAAEGFTEAERRVLELLLARERQTRVYAEVLGVRELSPLEQEREVKRVKDRILVRLKREAKRHD